VKRVRLVIAVVGLAAACTSERERDGAPSEGVHGPGLLDPASPGFHGTLLAERGWDFALCRSCHGEDDDGGTSGVSCLGCHEDGPTSCTTCHDETTGAHAAHLTSPTLDRAVPCGECHVVPSAWDDPGHIVGDSAPAEVVLGALAARDVVPPRRTEPPSYDPATATCAGVYCHGGTLGDSAATAARPTWSAGAVASSCGACHGAPPSDHPSSRCTSCHPAAPAAHLDGVLAIGKDTGDGCSACHGDATSPAPPRGLGGETSPQVLAVGVHRAHLDGPSRLRGPIACTECHVAVAELESIGHIDSAEPAEVFVVGSGMLARADGAMPAWDRTTGTCSGTYCHGAGQSLSADAAPDRITAPVWTHAGDGEAACGRCHGIPPIDGTHAPILTIADCATCHPATVDDFGNILFTGLESEHIDGDVD
jgi:predicted CxxxxCH...CXXCH cytochrome family protein